MKSGQGSGYASLYEGCQLQREVLQTVLAIAESMKNAWRPALPQ